MKCHSKARPARSEDGQVLPLMCMLIVVMCGIVGLAVDLGRLYVTRAQLSRSLDAAALAGVIELPNTSAATTKAVAYMNINMPDATNVTVTPDAPAQKVTMSATASVNTLFMKLIGVNSVNVHADAEAGASNVGTLLKLDAVLVLDDTGSIGSGCSTAQRTTTGQADAYYAGCPLGLERNAAKTFLDTLYPVGVPVQYTQTAMVPFRGCYNAAGYVNKYGKPNLNTHDEGNNPTWNMTRGCVSKGDINDLSNDPTLSLKTKIDRLRGEGGYPGTNLCLALAEGWRHLSDPTYAQPGARKVLVILSDGDTAYWDGSETANNTTAFTSQSPSWNTGSRNLYNVAPSNYPTTATSSNSLTTIGIAGQPNECWPTGAGTTIVSTSMPNTEYDNRINQLDKQALGWADYLKTQGVEIYIVGLGVSASPDANPALWCDASMRATVNAGRSDRRNTSTDINDRKLNKCMASSKSATNDHYFETTTAGLVAAFQHIATQISFRLIQ